MNASSVMNLKHDITQKEFELLKELMYKETGVFLKPSKKSLIVARLRTRLNKLKINSFKDYYELLKNPIKRSELEFFINSITTNETYFNRNVMQFNYIKTQIIPEYIRKGKRSLRVWSAASSTGEEAYTIAILLLENIPKINTWKINIYASDINSDVVKAAKEGVYPAEKLKKLSPNIIKKYFVKTESKFHKGIYHIDDNIKKMVNFSQFNLLSPPKHKELDIVFLSNVLIYFDLASKQRVINNISGSLVDNGYLFLGQSESLMGIKHDYKFLLPSSFQKQGKGKKG